MNEFKIGDLVELTLAARLYRGWVSEVKEYFEKKPFPWKVVGIESKHGFGEKLLFEGVIQVSTREKPPVLFEFSYKWFRKYEETDPYKAHEENTKNDPKYHQFIRNERGCSLCGEKGSSLNPISDLHCNDNSVLFFHDSCQQFSIHYSYILGTPDELSRVVRIIREKLFVGGCRFEKI